MSEDISLPVPRSYVTDMLSYGLMATIEWWVAGQMKDEPERVASYYSLMFSLS